MKSEIEAIVESLGECERDLLTGNVTGWGAWITATYPGLCAKGLMQRTYAENGLTVENTALGNKVASAIRSGAEVVSAGASIWFCEQGDFWGTVKQLCLCAKCGGNEIKRHDEPRHFRGIFTPYLHTICDKCFDSLPDDEAETPSTGVP